MAANGISTQTLKRTRQDQNLALALASVKAKQLPLMELLVVQQIQMLIHIEQETLLLSVNYLLGTMLQATQVHWLTMLTVVGL